MRIHIIRHTESEANIQDILAGQMDFPLSKKGKQDAREIAQWYHSHYTLHTIYCSPLLRTKQTADPFRKSKSIHFHEDQRLMEQHLGIFEGKTYGEIEKDPLYENDRMKRWNWAVPSGESYQDIATRIESFFSTLDSKQPDILIVTHAVTMRIIRGFLEQTLPIYPEKIAKNGEIWELEYKGIGEKHEMTSLFMETLSPNHHRA